eukprot:CAMPEP_0197658172 /NCGR_PEP_ID=MMETSP1338-20131121/45079_1 /TAXON_ID=43686 ORGANISM="Pelagodinium beii, Strain RCC1491" /NCGR_SAMPLE_ID=MMETSP1338 /ASSEMBLY_ACC=CAM_ASM_000754 /LENGTH=254 /DNA_ID=CAMNT_0043234711 /DNA_START=69 /DNA_END=833 /DNA_ORIENTATION=-
MADDKGSALAGLNMGAVRERSANLFSDPKMQELQNFPRSHQHENRLRNNAELEDRNERSEIQRLRQDGCDEVNKQMMRIASQKAIVPDTGPRVKDLPEAFHQTGELDAGVKDQSMMSTQSHAERQMNQLEPRLMWRSEMDRSLRRLMHDMDLARDERLKEYSHQARCGHLDRIFDWYKSHGKKEARKEQPAPPYVRYTVDGDVMAGSMRVSRLKLISDKEKGKKDPHGHSASSPSLMAAGSLGVGGDGTPKASA